MKLRTTITLDWEITGAEGVKDFDPQKVAEAMEWHLNDYEDGRYDLALETLRALIRNAPKSAIYSAITA